MAAGDHNVANLHSGENLDKLRRLYSGLYFVNSYNTDAVNEKESLVVSRAIDGVRWNRGRIISLCCSEHYLCVHPGNQIQLRVFHIDFRSHRSRRHL